MEEVKLYTDYLNEEHRGDFVRCADCGECGSENLEWYNDNKPEWTIEEVENYGFIIIELRSPHAGRGLKL